MNYYEIWCNLKDSHADVEFSRVLRQWLEHLQAQNSIKGWRLTRRKLGLGPADLGEFHITIQVEDLAQLDSAFALASTRSGEAERLHQAVYSRITDFRAALYRDFPDPQRAP